MSHVTAIIPAAGQGTRMGKGINKQFLLLRGKPVLVHTLEIFQQCDAVEELIVVAAAGEEEYCRELVNRFRFSKVIDVVMGGKERQDSVARGLARVSSKCSLVVVHDGARPLLLPVQLNEVISAGEETGAAVLAVPVKDTVKIVNEDLLVTKTLERKKIWAVQTPQVFRYEIIMDGFARAFDDCFYATDDAAIAERYGYPVKVVRGSYENIKITTPDDLELAELLLKRRA